MIGVCSTWSGPPKAPPIKLFSSVVMISYVIQSLNLAFCSSCSLTYQDLSQASCNGELHPQQLARNKPRDGSATRGNCYEFGRLLPQEKTISFSLVIIQLLPLTSSPSYVLIIYSVTHN